MLKRILSLYKTSQSPDSWLVNVLAMVLFGVAIGVLICFVGGLMAVDLVPRKATGAALGIVGMASYIAAVVSFLLPILNWRRKKMEL